VYAPGLSPGGWEKRIALGVPSRPENMNGSFSSLAEAIFVTSKQLSKIPVVMRTAVILFFKSINFEGEVFTFGVRATH
jgi:hypothetical protein